ncbi:MAG: hypothetical protein ACKO8G_08435 [Actinomycetota bacterium]
MSVRARERFRDDAGLIGKIIVSWLLFLLIAVVGVIDTGAILIERYRADAAASRAATDAAAVYDSTRDAGAARQAAEDAVAELDRDATIVAFDITRGRVKVVLLGNPRTLVAERLDFVLGDLVEVRVRAVADPPS